MLGEVKQSTRSMTGRLALFFTLFSALICLLVFVVFYITMKWTEDEVGEKRIMLDAESAIVLYQQGERGKLQLDYLTDAYDSLPLVPLPYRNHILKALPELQGGESSLHQGGTGDAGVPESEIAFLEEVSDGAGSGRMVYATEFILDGKPRPLILLSRIDEIELSETELGVSIALISGVFALMLTAFTLFLMRLSKGLIAPINGLSQQLQHSKGDPNAVFSINREAAVEFTQLTDQLNRYREEINRLIKREQVFGRYSSHELRTPLTIVKGASDLLQRSEHTEFQARQLARIKLATTQMTTMVDALLALVRYERESQDAEERIITETELARIVADHQLQLGQKKLQVDLRVDGEPEVRASEAIIAMVVGNLLRNAISASEEGNITVLADSGSISVVDQGRGLQSTPFAEGHGLGLMLVDDLCQRYGWLFSLQSREDDSQGCMARIDFTPQAGKGRQSA